MQLVFSAAFREMKIFPLLDVEDLVSEPMRCDERSVITYVSEFLKYYNSEEKLIKDLDREFARYFLSPFIRNPLQGEIRICANRSKH